MIYKLSKQGLLRKNKNFQAVYRKGKSYANRLLVLYVLPTKEEGRRAGFVASKKLGKAVVRNRVKRLMREAYRLTQPDFIQGVDLVFIARQGIVGANYAAVHKAMLDLAERARLFIK